MRNFMLIMNVMLWRYLYYWCMIEWGCLDMKFWVNVEFYGRISIYWWGRKKKGIDVIMIFIGR